MSLLKTHILVFFVRCAESIPCPCCGEQLEVIGSRRRQRIRKSGEVQVLVIRRLRCTQCRRIHHELPDCLVPYKRYESECVEQGITDSSKSVDIAVDDSTLYRWKTWFHTLQPYLLGCLKSIAIRLRQDPVEEPSVSPRSAHQRIGQYVGEAPGWLARIVRPIANMNLWLHTRSAFLSGSP
ncbi:DUF6431 domain-containing protein [Desulfitobacterium sp.]|uniref:DUF6431 domain-containing protein n=1 Tax=Desulfitobacterium sp. TaxID=49981 RepID=UPI002C57A821|nr:DUF6431 domain-containing protein [Desulfitobacterium sp.]HVJ49863.1 DUF6431 domain-containing protein [Desulfitobacterium sp.]